MLLIGKPWPAERDAVLKAIQAGTLRARAARPPKKRLRGKLLLRLVTVALHEKNWAWAAGTVFCYFFLLRMPSEFFRQFSPHLLSDVAEVSTMLGWLVGLMALSRGKLTTMRLYLAVVAAQQQGSFACMLGALSFASMR